MMKPPTLICSLTSIFILYFSSPSAASSSHGHHHHHDFLKCLTHEFHNYSSITTVLYTPSNSSFTSLLRSSIKNLRYAMDATPKPQAIITPDHESQIPLVIFCARKTGVEIRTRSGGHDFEGLSSVSQLPFVIIDLINLSDINVDVGEKTAWVGAGSTIGSLYYTIAQKSPVLGFPAGIGPTIGVGGHFSGGGYGTLFRKYGLSADNVIDARIINVNGGILDRESMGEGLFWAIRGGGGASFGVIVAWKVQLVDVPETVTVFRVRRTLEQNVTGLLHRWQYIAPKMDKDLFIGVIITKVNTTIVASFFSLFLGGADRLLPLVQESFPELGLVKEDCIETSWIKSVLQMLGDFPIQTPLEVMLDRSLLSGTSYTKIKSSYVQKPVPVSGLEGAFRYLDELKPEEVGSSFVWIPYGGRMAEISESATPFPHRAGNLYSFTHYVSWGANEAQNSDSYITFSRRCYDYLTPYVASNPRSAYLNYRDLDLGVNKVRGKTSYARASVWGKKYVKNNFARLVRVKTKVDPHNFFRFEQSYPSIYSKWAK